MGLKEGRRQKQPVVVGALGSVTGEIRKCMENIGMEVEVASLQKPALRGTARIQRKVLEM